MIENSFGSRQEECEEEEYDDDDGAATPLQQSGIELLDTHTLHYSRD